MRHRRHARSLRQLGFILWNGVGTLLINLLALVLIVVYLSPMAYVVFTALKPTAQFADARAPVWPATVVTARYRGEEYPVYNVPTEQGIQKWALVTRRSEQSQFIDRQIVLH